MYVLTAAKRMLTDHFPAQHDFSQDPVFVKCKEGHLVRRRTSLGGRTKGFGFSVPSRRVFWEIRSRLGRLFLCQRPCWGTSHFH